MGIEGVSAIELGDLAKVAEIVIGEFVEHLGESDDAHFVVLAGAVAHGGRTGVEVGEEGAAKSDEFLKMAKGGFLLSLYFGMRNEFGQSGRMFEHDELRTLLVKALDDGHVSEDFGNGPAVGGGFPVEEVLREVSE